DRPAQPRRSAGVAVSVGDAHRCGGAGAGPDELPRRAAHRAVLPHRGTRLACGACAAEPGARECRADRNGRVSAVLVIAGSDSSGGAGLARDLHTLARFDTQAVSGGAAVTLALRFPVVGVPPV